MMMSDILPPSPSEEYICLTDLNLYNSPETKGLTTQAAKGRYLRAIESGEKALQVRLCEDDYPGWLPIEQINQLIPADRPYQPVYLTREAIVTQIPEIIKFTIAAMEPVHEYLWGGTIAPNYDCSGLMQAAFAASGIWIPRDSYQQEEFTTKIPLEELQPGDLIFFKEKTRVSHVALYLGEGNYIHSSGKEKGRNGIGIDVLSADGTEVGSRYYRYFFSAGRVMHSYHPKVK